MDLEIIGILGECSARIYDMYLKGVLCESELKELIGRHNYEWIRTLRQ